VGGDLTSSLNPLTSSVFNNLKQALASNDLSKVQQTAQEYQQSPAARDLASATAELKKKGYDIGALGGS
jgi:hypothetical protein